MFTMSDVADLPRPIYPVLLWIADHAPGLLVAYREDLIVHDRNTLEVAESGSRWIWCLRESGTHSHDPIWITYHIHEDSKARFFVIDVVDRGLGTVSEITPAKAHEHGKPGAVTVSLS